MFFISFQMSGEPPDTELKTVRSHDDVVKLDSKYLGGNAAVRDQLLQRFKDIRSHFQQSEFFKNHEVQYKPNTV